MAPDPSANASPPSIDGAAAPDPSGTVALPPVVHVEALSTPAPWTLAAVGVVLLAFGLAMEEQGPFGFSLDGALAGVLSQLATTLPAAIAVLVATVCNVIAGSVVVRAWRGCPFESASSAALEGFVGATLLDLVLLAGLGGTGLFRWPILVLVHLAVLLLGARLAAVQPLVIGQRRRVDLRRALTARQWPEASSWWPLWFLIAVCWSGIGIVQLASPVVPFVDVLPNHVAPVEHLRTFGDFATLTTTASPIYGPSRTFLGYAALLGVVDTLANLPAALGVAAFAVPGAIAVALGVNRLAGSVGGRRAGIWAVLAFALTTSFVRLPDARATVLVLPLACWSLAQVADRVAGRTAARPRDAVLLGAGLAAAIAFHPVIGALAAISVGLATLARPRATADLCVPALVTAAILMLPQVATMTEVGLPTIAALLAIPPGVAAGWLTARSGAVRAALVVGGRVAVAAVAVAALLAAPTVLSAAWTSLGHLLPTVPLLVATTVTGLLLDTRRFLNSVLIAGLAAGAIVATATELAPAQGTLMTALRFEVPKTLHYWLPVVFALAAGITLDSVWLEDRVPALVPRTAIAAFLVVAILPLRPAPLTDAYYLGERRVGETVALQLQVAERGYWQGYPDPRRLVAADEVEILDAVRAEIAAERLGARTGVLHVARSFQQWAAVPLGVFSGVIETDVTPDAEVSIHTVGGRLRPLSALDAELQAAFGYVLLEPAGLPPDTRSRVVGAGYRPIFRNERGELFVHAG